jgi:hypothetical protein
MRDRGRSQYGHIAAPLVGSIAKEKWLACPLIFRPPGLVGVTKMEFEVYVSTDIYDRGRFREVRLELSGSFDGYEAAREEAVPDRR